MTFRELKAILAQLADEDLDQRVYYYAYKPEGEELHSVNSLRRAAELLADSALRPSLSGHQLLFMSPQDPSEIPVVSEQSEEMTLEQMLVAFGPPTAGGSSDLNPGDHADVSQLMRIAVEHGRFDLQNASWLFWAADEVRRARLAMRIPEAARWKVVPI